MDADIFVSGKKKLRIQKYPDTCGRGLNLKRSSASKLEKSIGLKVNEFREGGFNRMNQIKNDKIEPMSVEFWATLCDEIRRLNGSERPNYIICILQRRISRSQIIYF